MKTILEASATNEGGRSGIVISDDGTINLDVRMPGADGVQPEGTTNPEQLFAAAYSSCFAGSLEYAAKQQGIDDLGEFSVTAAISFNLDEEGTFLEATLDSYLPTLTKEKGEELINIAHEICPYSKATRDNITVHLNLLLDD